jgi:hypothetical protein
VVQEEVLEKLSGKSIEVFVVWAHVWKADSPAEARNSMKLIPDKRTFHFWDEKKELGYAYAKVVDLPERRGKRSPFAWDIYFVFDGEASWKNRPPEPRRWMHQLGQDRRRLDGKKLRFIVEALLPS